MSDEVEHLAQLDTNGATALWGSRSRQRPVMIMELSFRFLYLMFDRVLEVHQQVAGLLSDPVLRWGGR
jgi:hypothetical protein